MLCTYEVYALCAGRAIPLADALHMGASLNPNARLVSTHDPSEGFQLAWTPGRWRDSYGERSPADFDLDADKGVLCWNARLARADVISGKKLPPSSVRTGARSSTGRASKMLRSRGLQPRIEGDLCRKPSGSAPIP